MEQKEAFEKVKGKVADAAALGFFTKDAKTTVVADASPVGLRAVLIREKEEGVPGVSRYASKALSDVEKRYSQTEKEALALVWACEKFQIYLLGMEFDLITDHKPLEVIFGPRSKPSERIERFVLRMPPFHYQVIYKPGKSNIADPLSRLLNVSKADTPAADDTEEVIYKLVVETIPVAMTLQEVKIQSEKDEELQTLKKSLQMNF